VTVMDGVEGSAEEADVHRRDISCMS
jgi:hypothetical protein